MKTLRYIGLILLTMAFAACNDDTEPKYATGTQPASGQMTSPAAGKSYVLTADKDNEVMDTYIWSVTNFGIPVGTRYTLLMDKAGGDFSNAYMLVASTTATTAAFTVKQINDAMMALKCFDETPTNMKMRISTTAMGGESSTLVLNGFPTATSGDFSLVVTPYKGEIPVKASLFIVGSVFEPGYSWTNSLAAVGTGLQPFYSGNNVIGDGKYTYTGYFPAGKAFKLVGIPGSWDVQYGYAGTPGKLRGKDASGEGSDLATPEGGGWYRLDVDINALTYAYTKIETPAANSPYTSVKITGEAVPGGELAMTQFTENPHIWLVSSTALNLSGDGLIFETNTGEHWACPAGNDDCFPFGAGANSNDEYIKPLNGGNYCVMFNDITRQYTFVNLDKYN